MIAAAARAPVAWPRSGDGAQCDLGTPLHLQSDVDECDTRSVQVARLARKSSAARIVPLHSLLAMILNSLQQHMLQQIIFSRVRQSSFLLSPRLVSILELRHVAIESQWLAARG